MMSLVVVLSGSLTALSYGHTPLPSAMAQHAVYATSGNDPVDFPPCDAAHDGDVFVDGEDGQVWFCTFIQGAGWTWVPKEPPDNYSIGQWKGDGQLSGLPLGLDLVMSGYGVPDANGGMSSVGYFALTDSSGNPVDQPPGSNGALIAFDRFDSTSGFWANCTAPDAGYVWNTTTTNFLGAGWHLPGGAPCGPGWYTGDVTWAVFASGSWWIGGIITNPTGICLGSCGAAPPPPAGTRSISPVRRVRPPHPPSVSRG
jgi:hypothetical protein